MKLVIVFAALFAVAMAAPAQQEEVQILRQDVDVHAEGYNFASETSDGSSFQEEGHLNNVGTEQEAIAVKGSFSFVAPDGNTYTVNYIADENGFQPEAAHLPVAPVA